MKPQDDTLLFWNSLVFSFFGNNRGVTSSQMSHLFTQRILHTSSLRRIICDQFKRDDVWDQTQIPDFLSDVSMKLNRMSRASSKTYNLQMPVTNNQDASFAVTTYKVNGFFYAHVRVLVKHLSTGDPLQHVAVSVYWTLSSIMGRIHNHAHIQGLCIKGQSLKCFQSAVIVEHVGGFSSELWVKSTISSLFSQTFLNRLKAVVSILGPCYLISGTNQKEN